MDIKFRFTTSYFAVALLSYVFEYSRDLSYSRQVEANEKAEKLLRESLAQQSMINIQNNDLEKINKELEKLSIVASETENAVAIASVEGVIEWVNAGFTKLYGYTYDEFIKIRGANIIKSSTNTDILEAIIECLGSRQPVIYTSPNITKDGRKIWVQTSLTPVYSESGAINKLVLIDSDITKIIEAEEEIKQQNEEIKQQNEEIKTQRDQLEDINKELEKLSIVARETDNSVIIANKEGNIEWVNEGFSKLWGFSLEEFKKLKGSNILDHKNNKYVSDLIEDCLENKHSVVFVVPAASKFNPSIWIQTTLNPILDINGKISRLVAIEVEITDIKEAEEEIKQQNEEIKQQNEEISTQRDSLNAANLELTEMNELLTDSIQYAKLIQTSILPKEQEIKKYNPDSFIYFKPKAIVSGDFYWFHGFADKYIVAVADCTGHGVPGAFMSMIGNTILNRIIKEEKIYDPALILERLNAGIIDSLNQGSAYTDIQDDGMDISICYVDNAARQITIACANQMAFVAQNNELNIIKGSIYSIGGLISYKSFAALLQSGFFY
jgi:PAS domain S-box-containing protein